MEDHYVENLGRILSFIDLLQETVPGGGKAWRHLADNALPPKLCEVLAVIQLLHQQHSGFRDEVRIRKICQYILCGLNPF